MSSSSIVGILNGTRGAAERKKVLTGPQPLVPDWREMRDPIDGNGENRNNKEETTKTNGGWAETSLDNDAEVT